MSKAAQRSGTLPERSHELLRYRRGGLGPENFPVGVTNCCGHSKKGWCSEKMEIMLLVASSLRFRWGVFWGGGFRFGIIDQHGVCGDGELGMRALVIARRLNRINNVDLFNKNEIRY